MVLARELTKTWESIQGKPVGELLAWIKEDENRRKGEMVLIAEGAKPVQDEEFSPKFCVHWRLCRKNCRRKSGCGGGGTVRREENALYRYTLDGDSAAE